jgi:hypothetical protein
VPAIVWLIELDYLLVDRLCSLGMETATGIPQIARKPASLRSRVTNGKTLFASGGDNRGAWARRWRDLYQLHLSDYGGREHMSEAELAICGMAATTRVEMERLAARMSEGAATPEDVDLFNRLAGNLRRHLESIGLERRARPVNDGSSALVDYFSRPVPKEAADD